MRLLHIAIHRTAQTAGSRFVIPLCTICPLMETVYGTVPLTVLWLTMGSRCSCYFPGSSFILLDRPFKNGAAVKMHPVLLFLP